LGYAAWLKRGAILAAQANPPPAMIRLPAIGWTAAATAVMVLIALWLDASIAMVWGYTFVGVGLLIIALFSEQLAWQVALIVTYGAFALDLTEYLSQQRKLTDPFMPWDLVGTTTLVFSFLVARREQSGKPMVGWAFLGLTWLAVLVSYLKSLMHPTLTFAHGTVELIFTLSTVALTWFVVHESRNAGARPLPGHSE
jgi:hypothetical protein